MVNDVIKDLNGSLDGAIEAMKRELSRVRTGRANLSLLDGIKVEYYGTPDWCRPHRVRQLGKALVLGHKA